MPRNGRMDLANLDNNRRWENLLMRAEALYNQNFFRTPKDSEFVKEMLRRNKDERPIWNPSLNQYNYLHSLVHGGES